MCVLLQLVERCPFAVCFMSALDKSCSLHQLVHYQHKLQQLQQHVLQGTNLAARDAMCHCPSLVKVRWTLSTSITASALQSGLQQWCASAGSVCGVGCPAQVAVTYRTYAVALSGAAN
jgi:hypothetical protein